MQIKELEWEQVPTYGQVYPFIAQSGQYEVYALYDGFDLFFGDEELGRFETQKEVMEAAQKHHDKNIKSMIQ